MANKNPDIHLISIFDHVADSFDGFETVMKRDKADELITLERPMMDLLRCLERRQGVADAGMEDYLAEMGNKLIEDYRSQAEEAMGKELVDEILRSRAKVHFVIDSPGGNRYFGDYFTSQIERAKRQGMQSVAYVTREASSLACNLMFAADKAYCLNDSHVMWHVGRVEDEVINPMHQEDDGDFKLPEMDEEELAQMEEVAKISDEETAELDNQAWSEFTAMTDARCKPERRVVLSKKLNEARGNDRMEVVFSGAELKSYGLIKDAVDSTRALLDKFCAETEIKVDMTKDKSPVGKFFCIAALAEKVSKKCGFNVSLRLEGRSLDINIIDERNDDEENLQKVRQVLNELLKRNKK
ncbi:hypothetical protein KBB06_03830 [Candidatus Gracilibacteria bacterium]|nr:hypothetical protein [Candidatus Gracilibacteria bacterium]